MVEQKRGALTILDQLADRERERAASEEARRREGEEMKTRIQQLREEEQQVRPRWLARWLATAACLLGLDAWMRRLEGTGMATFCLLPRCACSARRSARLRGVR